MKIALAAAAALSALALAATADAQPRRARCVINSSGAPAYSGPCRFQSEARGSFTVTPASGRSFAGGVTSISVAMAGRGTAEVRGLTRDGINSRWGTATRSRRDRACWVGEDFSVCAY